MHEMARTEKHFFIQFFIAKDCDTVVTQAQEQEFLWHSTTVHLRGWFVYKLNSSFP